MAMPSQATSDKQTIVSQEKKVIVNEKTGGKLVGILHEAGSLQIVIICHGYMSSKDDEVLLNLATSFDKEGISSFRFDFSGNGESDGSFQLGNYESEADDLHAIVQYFNGASRSVCTIIGHSKGGDVVLVYASKYKDVDIVINVCGRFDMTKGIEKSLGENYEEAMEKQGFVDIKDPTGTLNYKVTQESLMERLNTNMRQVCLHINQECRVLTVHGTEDEIIPVDDAKEFDKIISNHKLYILEGADHNYTAELHQVELATVVLDFIKTSLQQVNYAMPLTCISSSVSQLLQTSEVINHIQDFPQEG
uniref:Serine aminopeptidase S33 domain-containing protein n=1 Tax=Cucumis melo TaxID=3656 RepID=A0A9I9DAI8_CUCME